VWVKAPEGAHNMDRFATTLDTIPGEKEPISWGVFPLMGDDAFYVRWNGGGGVGDPLTRDPEAVRADIVNGVISAQAAAEVYGVVVKDDRVDLAATDARRKAQRAARLTVEAAE
jgi:N-methylhydantoinase B